MYGALCATNNQHGEVKGVKLIMWKQDSFSFHNNILLPFVAQSHWTADINDISTIGGFSAVK